MWNVPSQERLSQIPKLYETEHTPLQEKLVYLHFFVAGCDWWVCEYDGSDTFWGYIILNKNLAFAEWGYFNFTELRRLKAYGWLEIDCETDQFWKVRPASEIDMICKGNGWSIPKESAAA